MESREDKSLFQNHVFTFKISRFTIFIFLLIILWFSAGTVDGIIKLPQGPYGPIRAHMGPNLFKKLLILVKNHEIINKIMKIVNLGILKVKTWFGDKDL